MTVRVAQASEHRRRLSAEERGPCENAERFRGVQVRNERPMSACAKRSGR